MKKVVVLLFLVSSVYVTGVYSAFGLTFDIPNLSAPLTTAIGSGIAPLVAVNASVNENIAQDTTGTLDLVQKVIGNASTPLDALLKELQDDAITTSSDQNGISKRINDLSATTSLAAGFDGSSIDSYKPVGVVLTSAKTYAAQLSTKLSAPVYGAITKAITVFIDYLAKDGENPDSFSFTVQVFLGAVGNAIYHAATPSTVANDVTPATINLFTTSIANIKSAVDALANALQQGVWELFPPTIDPLITARLPNIVPLLVSFNASADSTRNSLKQTTKSLANDATSAYNSVTSSPWNWNDGNIANLTKFLTNFTTLLQTNFTQSLDAGIDFVKANVNATLAGKIKQLGQLMSKVYTNISDSSIKSSSIFKANCVSRYNTSLLTLPATLNRLGNCIQLESDSLDVINSHAREAIRKTKDDATKSMNQLQLCREQSGGACTKKIFASFENQYNRAVTALTLISDYTFTSLRSIAGRVSDCTSALSDEIQAQVLTLRVNFNDCLSYGYWR